MRRRLSSFLFLFLLSDLGRLGALVVSGSNRGGVGAGERGDSWAIAGWAVTAAYERWLYAVVLLGLGMSLAWRVLLSWWAIFLP